jgi:hypothetical protein
MRWDDFRRSDNIDDVRDGGGGGGGFGLPGGAGGLGIGTVVVLGLVGWALGIDPRLLIGGAEMVSGGSRPAQYDTPRPGRTGAPSDQLGQFVSAVLGDTEDRWNEIFQQAGRRYRPPRLTLFQGRAPAGQCGIAQSAMGPFYCPPDMRIFLDTAFFRDLQTRFRSCGGGAGGKTCEFAQAYVIAHEVGHHVQNELGILSKAEQAKRGTDRAGANRIQVRVELQADCFAGIWANRAQQKLNFIDPGDVEAAMRTAAAIGDDRLQQQSRGTVVPDSFTHGTSAQRQRWFSTGFKEGKVPACNTFNTDQL